MPACEKTRWETKTTVGVEVDTLAGTQVWRVNAGTGEDIAIIRRFKLITAACPVKISVTMPSNTVDNSPLDAAIRRGIEHYFRDCRHRIPGFVRRYFRYPGAWHLNRHALGADLLRAPANLFWAPMYTLLQLLAWFAGRCGSPRWQARLRRVPPGFTTRVQREIVKRIHRDLLCASATGGPPEYLLDSITDAIAETLPNNHDNELWRDAVKQTFADALHQYAATRTASADIGNTLLSTLVGAFALKKFTPGGFAIAVYLAGLWANGQAAENFFLGRTVGSWFYQLFPVTPSFWQSAVSTLIVLALMAAFAAISGLLTDPVQALSGMHRRRLRRMMDDLQRDIENRTTGSFRPKDHYLARLFESIDAVRTAL